MKKRLFMAVIGMIVVVLVALVIATPKLEPDPPLPVPNGYDDFIKAAILLDPNPPYWQGMSGEEQHEVLRKLVATNKAAMELVRLGMEKRCLTPPWRMTGTNTQHLNDLANFKAMAQSLTGASQLALIEGRTNEAGVWALDCIRFGNEAVRGGVLIDGLMGIAIRSMGLWHLKNAINGMDLKATREGLSTLESVFSNCESWEEVIKREKQWARRGRFGSSGLIVALVQPFQDGKNLQRAQQKFITTETDLMRMQIQLASHAYELDHGKPPGSVNDLVPQHLKSVPLDPATGQELPLQ